MYVAYVYKIIYFSLFTDILIDVIKCLYFMVFFARLKLCWIDFNQARIGPLVNQEITESNLQQKKKKKKKIRKKEKKKKKEKKGKKIEKNR